MAVSTILFDMDGTLLDTTELTLAAFEHTWQTHFGTSFPRSRWEVGRVLQIQFAQVARNNDELMEMMTTFRDFTVAHHDELTKIYPGIREMLSSLSINNIKLGVVTSKIESLVKSELAMFGCLEYFDVLVCADTYPEHKPHPGPLLRAIELLREPKERALYVGDSHLDIQAARNAGIRCVAVTWGPAGKSGAAAENPDFTFSAPHELTHFLLSQAML